MRDLSLAVLALFLAALTGGCASAQQSAPAVPGPHALLIGCTRYPALPQTAHLEGPANDVVLIETLLKGPPYRFPSESIVVLSERTKGSEYRPTRANIEREFARLAQVARPGEQVVIAFRGHGSQQPDQEPPDPDDPEPDGKDETILPSDTGRWDERTQTVVNAIIDDELRAWLKRISERGALVWVIMDSCHSGTVVRAETAEVNRKVDPEVLGVPRDALERAERRAAQRMAAQRGETREAEPLDLAGQAPDLVAVYAALPTEPTPEMPPLDGSSPDPYGLLTYSLRRAITMASTPLSYTDLVQRIRLQYAAWCRTFPTPLVEGKYRDREVLNTKEMPSRARILLTRDAGGRATINAGSLQGLSERSVLAVYPPPGDPHPDTPVGHVRIQPGGLALLDAQVEPWRYGDDRVANPDLPNGGRCQPVYIDLGRMRLGVAVKVKGDARAVRKDEDQKTSRELQQRVDQELRQIAKSPGALIELHDQPRPDDWLVWIEEDRAGRFQAYLAPASGWVQGKETEEAPPLYGPAPGELLGVWLDERLRRIARAQHLVKIAGGVPKDAFPSDTVVRVEVLKFRNWADTVGQVVVPGAEGIVLQEGDIIAFRLTNPGSEAIDISLLFVDSGEGISPFFPTPGTITNNRLPGGRSLHTPHWRVTGATIGVEHMVVIAVRAQGEPLDFSGLAQPTLERARGASPRGAATLESPLGRLFQAALYGAGDTRGLSRDLADNCDLQLISWRTVLRRGAGK